jgi:hypothetical protein
MDRRVAGRKGRRPYRAEKLRQGIFQASPKEAGCHASLA